MSRRVVFLIALISLVVLGAAAVPWTLTGSRLSSAVTRHLRSSYGVEFAVEGRSTFALLPTPRVKFERMTLAAPDGTVKAEGGILRGELHLLSLLVGRIELSEIMLSETKITASRAALASQDWRTLLKERPGDAPVRRLIIASSSLQWTDLKDADLDKVNLLINWAGSDAPLYAAGSASWRGEVVRLEQTSFHPTLLASDRLSPIQLTLAAPTGRLSLTGEAQLGDDPRVTGESLIQATSLRGFTRWSGMKLPFGPQIQAVSIQGDVSMNRRRLSWPSVVVSLGEDKLEGTMAVRLDSERPLITGTLAADSLNLSDFVRPLVQARVRSGGWSDEAIDLAPTTGSDLDLRISATTARLRALRIDDMAASVLVRPGRIEASVGRAELYEGTVKGRLSLSAVGDVTELKGQGSFDDVDLTAFLGAIGETRWIAGLAQGQVVLEGVGRNPAELVRQTNGRIAVTVGEGELVGIALDDALRRVEKRPLLASLNWRGGRTAFDHAHAQVVVNGGVGTVAEGRLSAPGMLMGLQGTISLVDRALDLQADASLAHQPPNTPPMIAFDVSGHWDNVEVRPEARALIERSGAAKPLFGPRPAPQSAPAPSATAQ
jgi:AsmA protein